MGLSRTVGQRMLSASMLLPVSVYTDHLETHNLNSWVLSCGARQIICLKTLQMGLNTPVRISNRVCTSSSEDTLPVSAPEAGRKASPERRWSAEWPALSRKDDKSTRRAGTADRRRGRERDRPERSRSASRQPAGRERGRSSDRGGHSFVAFVCICHFIHNLSAHLLLTLLYQLP